MLFAIDIDGTIAGISTLFGVYFNQELDLGLSPEEAQRIRWYHHLRKHPAIIEYRKAHNERFMEVWTKYREYAPAMLAREVIEGAVEGVNQLSQWGHVQYVTIRISQDKEINEQIQSATRQWLREHHFPQPEQVTFCANFEEKLTHVAHTNHDQVIFIDDRCSTDLFTCYQELLQNPDYKKLIEHLQQVIFVAFGKQELPENTFGLRMLPLPSWNLSSDLLKELHIVPVS